MVSLPSGTVTFVFSDIAGSTSLLKRLGDEEYATLLAVHRRLVREIFGAHEGQEIDTQGDAFFYSFVRARQAVTAAVELQRAHLKASWPNDVEVKLRLGLHTGEPAVGDEGYTGLDVVRASRIAAIGGPGDVLLSDTTRAITAGDLPAGSSLRALGDRQLKDIDRPEPIWQLLIDAEDAAVNEDRAEEVRVVPPAEGPSGSFKDFIAQARETIESRVMAEIERSMRTEALGIPPPPPTPPRRMSREIERLQRLRDGGALTDEQFQRAVDRLLERDDEDGG